MIETQAGGMAEAAEYRFPNEVENQGRPKEVPASEANSNFTAEKWAEENLANNPVFNLEEFEFNQSRVKRQEQKDKQRKAGFWYKVRHHKNPEPDLGAVDFAHEQALIDNADWDKKYYLTKETSENGDAKYKKELRKEYAEWQKLQDVVFDRMKFKRDNPDSPEAQKIKVLYVIMGGGVGGASGGGDIKAHDKLGFLVRQDSKKINLGPPTEDLQQVHLRRLQKIAESSNRSGVINTMVGISAGAAIAGYGLGGSEQINLGNSLFYDECTRKEFVNWFRLHKMINVGYIIDKMSKGRKRLDVEAIQNSPTDFYVQVADPKTGAPSLVNAKTAKEGILQAIHASMALPFVYRKKVEVNGVKRIDGGIEPLPIEQLIEKFGATDVVIVPNIPFAEMAAFKMTPGEEKIYAIMRLLPNPGSSIVANKVLRQKEVLREKFAFIKKEKNVNVCIHWPAATGLWTASSDPDEIKAAMYATARKACEDFGQPEKASEIQFSLDSDKIAA